MRSHGSWSRRTVIPVVCIAMVAATAPIAQAAPPSWIRPVGGSVVRPFQEPAGRYGSGHRGVDFAAPSGAPVRAANDGTVVFAGLVAGTLHVVIAHDGGLRTSSSYLSRVDVRVGQRVSRGAVIGAAGGTGEAHAGGVVHFGVRVGDRYIDPMLLFGPTDLTELVRLVPVSDNEVADSTTTAAERAALVAQLEEWADGGCAGALGEIGLGIGDGLSGACEVVVAGLEAGLDGLRWLGGKAAEVGEAIADGARDVVQFVVETGATLVEAASEVIGAAADLFVDAVKSVVRLGVALYQRLVSCPQPPPKARGAGSGNLAVAVGGLGSSRRLRADGSVTRSFHFDEKKLGYPSADVSFFSYDPNHASYTARDTFGDLHAQAKSLAEQIRTLQAQHPGRAVDLIGHSQGGVVIDLFLLEYYRGHQAEYPAIANVVTFASPHEGTPWASLLATADNTFAGHAALSVAKSVDGSLPLGSTALNELAENSPVIKEITQASFAHGPRFLSIMGSSDAVVPSSSGDVDGATKVVVPVGSWLDPTDDHSGIVDDDDALSAAQAHLAGGSPADSCGPLADVPGELFSAAIHSASLAVSAIGAQ